MKTATIIKQLDEEIDRLERARNLLTGHNVVSIATGRHKRVLSADARKRIANAQRRRWARVRAAKKAA